MEQKKKKNFFGWYFEKGLHEFLEIWKNFIVFIWNVFGIIDHFETLFSPFRRDVSRKYWRGLDIEKSLRLISDNIFSRLLGAVARLVVMGSGLFLLFLTIVFGLLLLLVWLLFPVFVALFGYLTFSVSLIYSSGLVFLVLYFLLILKAKKLDGVKDPVEIPLELWYGEEFFERICNRLGMTRDSFPKDILQNNQTLESFLKEKNFSMSDFEMIANWELKLQRDKILKKSFWRMENLEKIPKIGAQWKYAYTVMLDKYSTDLLSGDYSEYENKQLVGRRDEMDIMKIILQRPDQNCVIVVGDTGIGKNTLIHSMAREIRLRKSESFFDNKRILLLDLGRAISNFVDSGTDVEGKARELFMEAAAAGNVILVLSNFEQYLGKKSSIYHPDLAPILDEFLPYQSFQLIATSTRKEYHDFIEKHEQINKYFEVIEMREPTEEETLQILYSALEDYEKSRVIFTHEALRICIRESNSFNWSSPLPERAIDVAMGSLTYWSKKPDSLFVSAQTIEDFLSVKTGTPHGEIKESEKKKLLNLEELLHQQVIGQEEAINQVAEALRRARSGVGNSEKPVGSFLFLGPTGVGKTETAKALARTYFGDEEKMIRFDMSEFQNPSSIDSLIGSAVLGKQGRLSTMVKDNPYALILLDEIEKAYPNILDLFLQILSEGFMTDVFGEKINFRNTMIVATSNVGASIIKKEVESGKDAVQIKKEIIDYSTENGIFRLEFLNRFDGVIFFRPLLGDEIESVVKLLLNKLKKRILKEKNMEIEFSELTVQNIVKNGYDPVFGARSMNRYIEEKVESILAKKIIAGEIAKGGKTVIDIG